MSFMRRVRGVAATAATWGVTFAAASITIAAVLDVLGVSQPVDMPGLIDVLARVGVRWAKIGAAMGALFASTIILTQRGRTVSDLSVNRFSILGLTAGSVVSFAVSLLILSATGRPLPALLVPGLAIATVCGAIGASVANSSLHLAQRAKEPIELLKDPNLE